MNKKLVFCTFAAIMASNAALAETATSKSFYNDYKTFKENLKKDHGLTYRAAVSLFAQNGAPNGKITPMQWLSTVNVNWNAFKSDYGDGSFQAGYTKIRYWGRTAEELQGNIGTVNPINHYFENQNRFQQLSYTHKMPGKYNWISVTAGQFPIYLFDYNPYAANQQMDFNNFALTQGLADTYSMAGVGAFVKMNPTDEWQFAFGAQDANTPIKTRKIYTSEIDDGKYTSFVAAKYTPTITNVGKSYVSLMLWNRPDTDWHKGESNGWSLNLAQDFGDKWALFAGANANTEHTSVIDESYLGGVVYKDPFNRKNPHDRIGLGVTYNMINQKILQTARSEETVVEAYWNYGVTEYFVLSPDFQYYYKPGLNPDHNNAFVTGLRATLLF